MLHVDLAQAERGRCLILQGLGVFQKDWTTDEVILETNLGRWLFVRQMLGKVVGQDGTSWERDHQIAGRLQSSRERFRNYKMFNMIFAEVEGRSIER